MYYFGQREAVAEPFFMRPAEFIRELLEEADEAVRAFDQRRADRLVQRARAEAEANR